MKNRFSRTSVVLALLTGLAMTSDLMAAEGVFQNTREALALRDHDPVITKCSDTADGGTIYIVKFRNGTAYRVYQGESAAAGGQVPADTVCPAPLSDLRNRLAWQFRR